MHERSRPRVARAFRRLQSQHELMTVVSLVSDDFGVFEEDGAAVSHRVGALGMGHGAWAWARKERYAGNILGWSPRAAACACSFWPTPTPRAPCQSLKVPSRLHVPRDRREDGHAYGN